jgi:hypothetical protein
MVANQNDMPGPASKHSHEPDRQESGSAAEMSAKTSAAGQMPGWEDLAGQIQEVLAPRKPTSAFRHHLRWELLEMAQGHPDRDVSLAESAAPRELIIGAAIGSVVALAGGIVYLLRTREHSRARSMPDMHMEQVTTQVG